jgi:hypothetical protein
MAAWLGETAEAMGVVEVFVVWAAAKSVSENEKAKEKTRKALKRIPWKNPMLFPSLMEIK